MGISASRRYFSSIQQIKNIIQDNQIVVFSKTTCPYCAKAKYILKDQLKLKDVHVIEIDQMGSQQFEFQDDLVKVSGHQTVPCIYINQNKIGGCDDLQRKVTTGEIKKILKNI